MNRFRLLTIGTMLMAALSAPAQQTATGTTGSEKDKHGQKVTQGGLPSAEQQLKVLTLKLDLTSDQQARIKPIVQELHDATEKLIQDKSLSSEERLDKANPHFYKADKEIRGILSEDQKKKLDQYEAGPHPEMHGNLGGAPSSPRQRP